VIAVPGNFAHPTSSEYRAAFSEPDGVRLIQHYTDQQARRFPTILIPLAINNQQTDHTEPLRAAESTGRDPN
jgi:hypothetical protein